jgi:diketogulonate reductase-like aldo/keto reductase
MSGPTHAAKRALREVLELLLESGGRMIDSSPMYGRAEAVVGDLLAEMAARPRAFLATKVWTIGRERGIEQMQRSARLLRDANT